MIDHRSRSKGDEKVGSGLDPESEATVSEVEPVARPENR
jgi:hypothetical protein